jgi:DNA-binding Lrp family transcriptional regulator
MKRTNFKGEVLEDVMEQKIDLVDRRILYLLSNNCRISDTAIAKTLRTSREVISYRVKQLMAKKLISGFATLMDPKKLGFVVYTIFIKLGKIKDEIKIIMN